MNKREREEDQDEVIEADASAGLSPSERIAKRRRQGDEAKATALLSSSSSSSSSSSAAAAPAFVPVMAYCCVNPLLGRCVRREVKDPLLLQATGRRLGCSLTKSACEKSCVLPGELLQKIGTGVGYGQKHLASLSAAMLTKETKLAYAKEIGTADEQAAYLRNLVINADEDDHEESKSALKELIFRLGQDMGKGVPGLGIWIANSIFSRMESISFDPLMQYMIAVVNTLIRRGYVDRFSEAFQKMLWSHVLDAMQAWVFIYGPADEMNNDGLLTLLDLAATEPKIGPIWTRDTLAQYLGTINPSKSWRPKENRDYAVQFYLSDDVLTQILGDIQKHLPKYMLEAMYRWILDKTFWSIYRIGTTQVAERKDWKIPALNNFTNVPYVGDLRDPWWQNALQTRFKNVWPSEDTKLSYDDLTLGIIMGLIKRPLQKVNLLSPEELLAREEIIQAFKREERPVGFSEKYRWLFLLMMGRNLVPDDDPDFKFVKSPILDIPSLTHIQILQHLRELRYANVLEDAVALMKKILSEPPASTVAATFRIWPQPFNYPAPGTQFPVGIRMLTAPIPPPPTSAPFFPVAPTSFPAFSSSSSSSTAITSSSSSSSTPAMTATIATTPMSGGTYAPHAFLRLHGGHGYGYRFVPHPPRYIRYYYMRS